MFFEYSSEIVKAAELVLPGHGMELVRMLDTLALAGFFLGVPVGMFLMYGLRCLFDKAVNSQRYLDWKKARDAVNHAH